MKPTFSDTVILVTREGMGDGPPELRMKLLATWCSLLLENQLRPAVVCFYADGVKVLVEGSPVLAALQALEAAGTHLVVCKTCVDFFGIRDRLGAGTVGGMGDIQAAVALARKVVSL